MAKSGYPQKVVSGGQTGVDRAALDAALVLEMPVGGWCPRGRLAQDGTISGFYPLTETPSMRYEERTEWNVRDSDGTLILHEGPLTGGTSLTLGLAKRYGRPFFLVDLAELSGIPMVRRWLREEGILILNVAGPREESYPGIYARAYEFMRELLEC